MRPSVFAKIMLLLIAVLFISIFTSCDITKTAQKSKTDTEFSENITRKSSRDGDTVSLEIPIITYKDTTIYTVSRQGTTLKTVYDPSGRLTDVDCISAKVDEFITEQRLFNESKKDKESKKEEDFDSSVILYGFIGLGIIIIIGLFALFFYLRKL